MPSTSLLWPKVPLSGLTRRHRGLPAYHWMLGDKDANQWFSHRHGSPDGVHSTAIFNEHRALVCVI